MASGMDGCTLFNKNFKENVVENFEKTENENQKSPVATMRELAQLNSITPAFDDINEEGPQHSKSYSITLTLGSQSWKGKGKSVKMAQTDAASKALEEFNFPKPIKSSKKKIANLSSLTPTVILNGLAMARGEEVKYNIVSRTPLPCQPIYNNRRTTFQPNDLSPYGLYDMHMSNCQSYNSSFNNNHFRNPNVVQRWIYPCLIRVEVTVGDRSFFGEGKTQQNARHNAAQKALEALQSIPIPMKSKTNSVKKEITKGKEKKSKILQKDSDFHVNGETINGERLKSSISELYEKASACRLQVEFEVIGEEGPAHLKRFSMKVIVRSSFQKPLQNGFHSVMISAEGEGPNKKMAKANAASAALQKLNSTPLSPETSVKTFKSNGVKPVEEKKVNPVSDQLHPVSRLAQIMQAKREKDPTYTVISSTKVSPRGTRFTTQCEVTGQKVVGEGRSKKDAKQIAAENMLERLGFSPPKQDSLLNSQPKKSILKSKKNRKEENSINNKSCNSDQRVKFKSLTSMNGTLPILHESKQEQIV